MATKDEVKEIPEEELRHMGRGEDDGFSPDKMVRSL